MYKYIILLLLYINSIYSNEYDIYNISKYKYLNSIIDNKITKLENISKCKLIVTSGYRTPEKNRQIGGAKNSWHLKDLARDLIIKGKCKYNYRELGKLAVPIFNGVITYHNHIHVDLRKKPFHKHLIGKKFVDII